ncbi:PIN domain-containing protein, partial [bacterium D16-51]
MTEYRKVFIDTAPFIYFIEGSVGNPLYSGKVKQFFKDSYGEGAEIITSAITIEEYNVFPYRRKQLDCIASFERLVDVLNIGIISIDKEIADKAARIRAEYKAFKAMDALQLA